MIKIVGVVGSGLMGRGIAQVTAQSGYPVIMQDISEKALESALKVIAKELDKGIERGKVTAEEKAKTLANITEEYLEAVAGGIR